jgi:hypothetical protein
MFNEYLNKDKNQLTSDYWIAWGYIIRTMVEMGISFKNLFQACPSLIKVYQIMGHPDLSLKTIKPISAYSYHYNLYYRTNINRNISLNRSCELAKNILFYDNKETTNMVNRQRFPHRFEKSKLSFIE